LTKKQNQSEQKKQNRKPKSRKKQENKHKKTEENAGFVFPHLPGEGC